MNNEILIELGEVSLLTMGDVGPCPEGEELQEFPENTC